MSLAAADGECVTFKLEQVILPRGGGDEFFDGCAKSSRTDAVKSAFSVVFIEALLCLVDMSVEEKAETTDR
ncbi:hypothetical protein DP113_13640 [Brasilonema octagenarum UFV-E1]|uniref:Uncharacterized protein n=1 Tax=Brasilonema sennae CENA114 TaxID=415709 RepID=A0A856MCA0_9CYAN|nr:hypothetical protein DP114_13695 [Brasilonema sennae CENA114]QDL15161.1 hypothetical protein DP113_13640 [Brasilonema octagenarum UFV-E1]